MRVLQLLRFALSHSQKVHFVWSLLLLRGLPMTKPHRYVPQHHTQMQFLPYCLDEMLGVLIQRGKFCQGYSI